MIKCSFRKGNSSCQISSWEDRRRRKLLSSSWRMLRLLFIG